MPYTAARQMRIALDETMGRGIISFDNYSAAQRHHIELNDKSQLFE
jgi:hypothetical protein